MLGTPDDVRAAVRTRYAAAAGQDQESCCMPSMQASCCCGSAPLSAKQQAQRLGYNAVALAAVPDGSNLGLGCGNPVAMAELKPGETVLDLGAGGGLDCFLAARQVGPDGRVIGVDMTPEMLTRARRNAAQAGWTNVEFRLGEIEHLPVADASVDVILSNCVINLSPQKATVFREAYRVLKPGGRLSISDVVATTPLPEALMKDLAVVASCIGGAALVEDIIGWLKEAGFSEVRVSVDESSRAVVADWAPGTGVERFLAAAVIQARRPAMR